MDKIIKVWDLAGGHEVLTLRGHSAGINCVAFSPDGRRLVSGSIDWTARVWDATPLDDSTDTERGADPSAGRISPAAPGHSAAS
jgi:WD40 repeat protein